MAMVHLLANCSDKKIGSYIVPIVPDEARTFGMEACSANIGIYSHVGQNYEPVDKQQPALLQGGHRRPDSGGGHHRGRFHVLVYRRRDGLLHFGHQHGALFFFYSMFGFQRIGDLIWAAGDIQARGFLLGATAGRTTLAGEGLQHQDGHSHILALPNPSVLAYDPAFAFEIAVIVREGLRRMLEER
jgi:pyruvate dehydrogenase E1 component